MQFQKKVLAKQVKRAFVMSEYMRMQNGRRYGHISREDFLKKLPREKARVNKLSGAQLDAIIKKKYLPRLAAYNGVQWYLGTVKTSEVAVWKGAGGIPVPWTTGSLDATAKKVGSALKNGSRRLRSRPRQSLPGIQETSLDLIQKDNYLLPIILPAGTLKHCRQGVKKFKGDIDDGCMRSIALALSGKKTIKAYIGKRP